MGSLHFTSAGWEDYVFWQKTDKKLLKKINRILEEIQRTPFEGIAKPELLKGDLSGAWSRRINDEHRLVYVVSDKEVRIVSCRFHYRKS